MSDITVNTDLVACFGLYCGGCSRYLKEKCPGCRENEQAAWCGVRACCLDRGYASCADCPDFRNVRECNIFNSFMARLFGFILRSDRAACHARTIRR